MYKKYGSILLLGNCIVLAALFCVRELEVTRENALMADSAIPEISSVCETMQYGMGQAVPQSQRMVEYHLLEQRAENKLSEEDELSEEYELSEENREVLLRIVEAEVG